MSEIDILSFGETMAMFVAEQTGDLAQVAQFHKRIAGADSNVAIGLSRLGFNVAWLSRVGSDSLGRFVVRSQKLFSGLFFFNERRRKARLTSEA